MAVRNRVCGPTQCGITALTPRSTKGGCKLDDGQRMSGAGLSCRRSRKAPLAVERAGLHGLAEGQKISFEAKADPRRGKTSAENLKAL